MYVWVHLDEIVSATSMKLARMYSADGGSKMW